MESVKPLDLAGYVRELELEMPAGAIERGFRDGEAVAPVPLEEQIRSDVEQAFIADKSLISFVSNVSGQNREDVLHSTLLAQMAANKKFSIETDTLNWYRVFADVLAHSGWVVEGQDITTFKSREDIYEVENVIVDILTSAFGGGYMAVIRKTLEAVKGLSRSDGRIVAFEQNTTGATKGCFQIGLAVVENDAVRLQLGTFLINSESKITRILFFRTKKDKTRLDYIAKKATLNTTAYSDVRELVKGRLRDAMQKFVAEIEI